MEPEGLELKPEELEPELDVAKLRAVAEEVLSTAEEFAKDFGGLAIPDSVDREKFKAAAKKVLLAINKVPAAVYVKKQEQVLAYVKIANLSEMNDPANKMYKLALENWERRESGLSNRVFRRQTRSAEILNQVFNSMWLFLLFQGVVLTVVSQLNLTNSTDGVSLCGKAWFPITLTSCNTIATIFGIRLRLEDFKLVEHMIDNEEKAQMDSSFCHTL